MKILFDLILILQVSLATNAAPEEPLIELVLNAFAVELKIDDSQEAMIRGLKQETQKQLVYELRLHRRHEQMARFEGLPYSDEDYVRKTAEIHTKAGQKLLQMLSDEQQHRLTQLLRWNCRLIKITKMEPLIGEAFIRENLSGDEQDVLIYREYTRNGLDLTEIDNHHREKIRSILTNLESRAGVQCRDIVSGHLPNDILDTPFSSIRSMQWLINSQLNLGQQGFDLQLIGDQLDRVRQVIRKVDAKLYADGAEDRQMPLASQELKDILGVRFYRRFKKRYLQHSFSKMNLYADIQEDVARVLGCSGEELGVTLLRLKEEKKAYENERAKSIAHYHGRLRDQLSSVAQAEWNRILGEPPLYLFGYSD